jgi:hypothetical protein
MRDGSSDGAKKDGICKSSRKAREEKHLSSCTYGDRGRNAGCSLGRSCRKESVGGKCMAAATRCSDSRGLIAVHNFGAAAGGDAAQRSEGKASRILTLSSVGGAV